MRRFSLLTVVFAVIAAVGAGILLGRHLLELPPPTPPTVLQGSVFVDRNGNWALDVSDQPVDGLIVKLYKKTTIPSVKGDVDEATTVWSKIDRMVVKDGEYRFTVQPGTYSIRAEHYHYLYRLPYFTTIIRGGIIEIEDGEVVQGPIILLTHEWYAHEWPRIECPLGDPLG